MSQITNQAIDPITPTEQHERLEQVTGPEKIDPTDAKKFDDLVEKKADADQRTSIEQNELMTPAELQAQIRDNIFKQGFNKAIERAREIAKENKA